MRNILLIITSVLLAAAGQLLLKKGMMAFGSVGGRAIFGELFSILRVPQVLVGLGAFGVSMILWLAVLSKNDLSFAYPMASLAYVIVVLTSGWLFHERIDGWKILGVVLICLGVTAITQTHNNTASKVRAHETSAKTTQNPAPVKANE